MSLTIQRPPDVTSLVHRHASANPPVSSQLVVGADDQVVVIGAGAVLGVVPPGSYVLYPQQLPFLAVAMAGDVVAVELWFVRSTPFRGVAFGGSLGQIVDGPTKVACEVRCFGDFALTVVDPVHLVLACAGGGDEPVVTWVKQVTLQLLGDGLAQLAHAGGSLLARELVPQLQAHVVPDLSQVGLAFAAFGSLTVTLSEESRTALDHAHLSVSKRTMQGATAAAARCRQCAKPHGGGKFCGECGAPV